MSESSASSAGNAPEFVVPKPVATATTTRPVPIVVGSIVTSTYGVTHNTVVFVLMTVAAQQL